MKLLAIDDNRDNLTTLKAVLADRLPEARLLTALSGPRGIELAQAEDPDVILLDIVMPGMDGYAVCRALKNDEHLRSIPVLFLTAVRTDRESRIKALEAGAEGFLSKPFDEVELTAQIRAMTKIKAANRMQRQEKEELAALVAERTRDLEQELEARKRTEEVLKASEDRFHGIFLGHDAIMLLIDPKTGAIRDANPAAVHFYGYTTEQLLQMTIEEINVLAAGEIARQRAMAQEQKQNYFVFPHRLANGEIRTVEVHSSPITVRDETLLFSIIHDITERKQSEEAVKREQLFSKAIIDSIPGAFYVLDERGRYARWNAYERDEIIGKSEGEITSLSAIETVHPDDRERVQERIVNVIKNGAAETLEARVLLRGGPAFRWLLLKGRQMVIDGHPFVVGLGLDIAARKQAEEDLRSEDQRLQFIIDGSRLGTWVWNVQTNQTQFNETWAAMIGYRSDELMPYSYGTWESLVHPDDLAVAAERLRRCVAGETTDYECEFRMRHKDGHWVWILDRGRIMTHDAAGAPLSMFGTHLDITERKRTEAALGESELVFRNLANAVPQIVWMTDAEGLNNYRRRRGISGPWRTAVADGLYAGARLLHRLAHAGGGFTRLVQDLAARRLLACPNDRRQRPRVVSRPFGHHSSSGLDRCTRSLSYRQRVHSSSTRRAPLPLRGLAGRRGPSAMGNPSGLSREPGDPPSPALPGGGVVNLARARRNSRRPGSVGRAACSER